jgi:hypothetical protein
MALLQTEIQRSDLPNMKNPIYIEGFLSGLITAGA